ncbi:hypothetical protein BBK36DRAFT_1125107 [Trichoderma citrinoviride]|uniref:Shugoshin n=1 Tax=Trichoderma citrinoviride TaxID=58853 RepID=A0A2T4B399_9HYPO|nr:hypothetical protein BBK36DRAFT_1125107 [Trichoderma citrinoviride]PTB63805.1 hypothetical protein BBK36DRAFT_1125107 [Trichoderma citrinoviride]
MARLNEVPVPTESLETLRKKMLRQNRELAKTNNIRALRIRELENECACMLSENLELRSRILELEKQVEDNEARRIADHAMAIKAKLESQLTEWGTLIAGLGLEPPAKRHSPMIKRRAKQTMSFSASRPSPSQRRLRDIARDIEELGPIAEARSNPRRSMNPEQIMALRSEANAEAESPELGPPPMSKYIEEDPIKVDSPSRSRPVESSDDALTSSAKTKRLEPPIARTTVETAPVQPIKAGSKRKFGARDDSENIEPQKTTDENSLDRIPAGKRLLHDKGDAARDFAKMRKKSQLELSENVRKPLAAKSTNDDIINSPKKLLKTKPSVGDEIATAKLNAATKPKAPVGRPRLKPKNPLPAAAEPVPILTIEPQETTVEICDLAAPIREPALLMPSSPVATEGPEGSRVGDTPPPADISSNGETSRPSRRNRTTISYTEPNLRAKMRRPTKELFDAVTGEGKYARRASTYDPAMPESAKSRRETAISDIAGLAEAGNGPASPLATKDLNTDLILSGVVTERRKRSSSIASKAVGMAGGGLMDVDSSESTKDSSITLDSSGLAEGDVYEFTSESPPPPPAKEEVKVPKKRGRRRTTTSRQSVMADDDDYEEEGLSARERMSSRRRSMMI